MTGFSAVLKVAVDALEEPKRSEVNELLERSYVGDLGRKLPINFRRDAENEVFVVEVDGEEIGRVPERLMFNPEAAPSAN